MGGLTGEASNRQHQLPYLSRGQLVQGVGIGVTEDGDQYRQTGHWQRFRYITTVDADGFDQLMMAQQCPRQGIQIILSRIFAFANGIEQ
ncbi:hypothetical protein D3C73_840340 [compost metagenome]